MTLYTIINNLCGISSLTALLESSDLYKSKTPPMGRHKINYSSIVAHDMVYVNLVTQYVVYFKILYVTVQRLTGLKKTDGVD